MSFTVTDLEFRFAFVRMISLIDMINSLASADIYLKDFLRLDNFLIRKNLLLYSGTFGLYC